MRTFLVGRYSKITLYEEELEDCGTEEGIRDYLMDIGGDMLERDDATITIEEVKE